MKQENQRTTQEVAKAYTLESLQRIYREFHNETSNLYQFRNHPMAHQFEELLNLKHKPS